MEQARESETVTLYLQLSSAPQNILPIRFLFLLRDELLSLYPDTVLTYDQIRGKIPRRQSPMMNGTDAPEDVMNTTPAIFQTNGTPILCYTPVSDPISKVFACFGLLEHILTYNTAIEITIASAVNRRWYEAGRNDLVWKNACAHLWKGKCWMPVVRRGNLAIYWRSLLTPDIIDRMTVKEIRSAFAERPLGRTAVQERLKTILEKSEMKQALLNFMPDHLGCENGRVWSQPFRHLWFGSYVSSVLDSTRSYITVDELCSAKGFDMHFKVVYEQDDTFHVAVADENGIRLHYHCTCYFSDTENIFRTDLRDNSAFNNVDIPWRWLEVGRIIQVGPYPPLTISRSENWGWILQNSHVILFSHE